MGIGSCEKNNEVSQKTIASFLGRLEPVHLTNEYNFPGWLTNKINILETESANDINIIKVKIYSGEWIGQNIYFVRNNLNSCVLCEIYDENGANITLTEKSIDSFITTSKSWKLIYEFGKGIF